MYSSASLLLCLSHQVLLLFLLLQFTSHVSSISETIDHNPKQEGAEYDFGFPVLDFLESKGETVPLISLATPAPRAVLVIGYFASVEVKMVQREIPGDPSSPWILAGLPFPGGPNYSSHVRICYGIKGSSSPSSHVCQTLSKAQDEGLPPVRVLPGSGTFSLCPNSETYDKNQNVNADFVNDPVDEECPFRTVAIPFLQTKDWASQIIGKCSRGLEKLKKSRQGAFYTRIEFLNEREGSWFQAQPNELYSSTTSIILFDPRSCHQNDHLDMSHHDWSQWSNTANDMARSRDETARGVAPPRGFTFYSRDMHVAPIADYKEFFSRDPWHHSILDQSVASENREHFQNWTTNGSIDDGSMDGQSSTNGTSGTMARVLTGRRLLTLTDKNDLNITRADLKQRIFEAAMNDSDIASADAFVCQFSTALCEAFMPFNRSLVVVAYIRYELGRHSWPDWNEWSENLRRIAANPRNVVAANNLYDKNYIEHFTGIQNVALLPSWCGYVGNASWSESNLIKETQLPVLLGPRRAIHIDAVPRLETACAQSSCPKMMIMPKYKTLADLAKYPAIVLISPYTNSIMSYSEYYRMNIPLFAPSLRYAIEWHMENGLLYERTWERTLAGWELPRRVAVPKCSSTQPHSNAIWPHLDPNNEFDPVAIEHWIAKSDFYQLPHVVYFDSMDDLVHKLMHINLSSVSAKMRAYNEKLEIDLMQSWDGILRRMFDGLSPASEVSRPLSGGAELDYERALEAMYPAAAGN